jgi:hypothetical protein
MVFVRSRLYLPSSGLSTVVLFVTFFSLGRSCIPPLPFISSHVLYLSFGSFICLAPSFLICSASLRLNQGGATQPLALFQRWLFFRSVRGSGTASPKFFIFPLLRSFRRFALVAALCRRSSSAVPAPRLPYSCRPTASGRNYGRKFPQFLPLHGILRLALEASQKKSLAP